MRGRSERDVHLTVRVSRGRVDDVDRARAACVAPMHGAGTTCGHRDRGKHLGTPRVRDARVSVAASLVTTA
jgi:hypothetical protein